MKISIERAIQILDPEHREHYYSIDPVNEACRMGMEALKEKLDPKITVNDIDRLLHFYKIVDQSSGRVLGEKTFKTGHIKSEFDRYGRRRKPEDRVYKYAPPWLKYEVVHILAADGIVRLFVKGDSDERTRA